MLNHLKSGTRALHTSAQKTVLYGWGQTQALPLTKGHMDRVFNQPTLLRNEQDYALPVSNLSETKLFTYIKQNKNKKGRGNYSSSYWLGSFFIIKR